MDVATTRQCLLLRALPGLGDGLFRRLLLACGSVEGLWHSTRASWLACGSPAGLWPAFERLRECGRPPAGGPDIEGQLASLEGCGAQLLALTDRDYPPLLRTIHDPPPLLYLRGDPDALLFPQLAVVGSRRASSDGLRAASEFSAAACDAGLAVTSGLALGIDGAAHRAALAAAGRSVAVMATGIEQVYPYRHSRLAAELLARGCLVTEFPPGSQPLREHFPRRNRIISGLSLGVLVVEAGLPSGSLITAGTALEQGREVFTLPWSVYHPGGRGCLRLLRDGATLVEDLGTLLQELGVLAGLQRSLSLEAPAAPDARGTLLSLVGDGCVPVEQLHAHSGLPLPRLQALLSSLEMEGLLRRGPGGYSRC